MIPALTWKDLTLYFRNPLYAGVTVAGLILYTAMFWLLPAEVDEHVGLGVYSDMPDNPGVQELVELFHGVLYTSQDTMLADVESGELAAGIAITEDAYNTVLQGQTATVPVWYTPNLPDGLRDSLTDIFDTWIDYNLVASVVAAETEDVEVVGPDIGEPVAPRQRILPMLVMMLFLLEGFGLATLLSNDIETGTVRALLVTPVKPVHWFSAKAILGVGLGLVQVVLLVIFTGQVLRADVPSMLLIALCGALLICGVGFFVAAISRGFMAVMGWAMVIMMTLMIPAFAAVFPALAAPWVTVIPSYYLVHSLHLVLNLGAGLADVAVPLMLLLLWGVGGMVVGTLLLTRRLA